MKSSLHLIKNAVCSGVLLAAGLLPQTAQAQLSSNPDKFLGNITTDWSSEMDYGGFIFADYWNQVTPENGTKWASVEGTRGHYNWTAADKAANYAKLHNFPFKFHTLVWGSQYPDWITSLSTEQQYEAVVKWMDAVKAHYPDLEIIDVVNEAIAGHAPAPFKDALGGDGITGYDWIIKAFEMAAERWPDAILIYNDYNTFQWSTDQFIDLVKVLRNAGAPIDAYGCQSHDLGGVDKTTFQAAMTRIQDALKMPMYITEYDIGDTSDANQKWNYMQHFPVMWEADYCAGVTLWGWFYGHTWINGNGEDEKGISGIIRDGQERSALKWLREYMQTTEAKTAQSPFPGMKKEASVYIKSSALTLEKEQPVDISISARLKTKDIQKIDLYVNNTLYKSFTSEPYEAQYTPTTDGEYTLKAVVTATDGSMYERLGGFMVYPPRAPYNGITDLPGTIQFEDFDSGAEGLSYHDSDNVDEGNVGYRSDNGGVDIVTGNNGYAVGYTASGEWLEYTVNVTKAGIYSFEAYASHGNNVQAGFTVSLVTDGQNVQLAQVNVPQTDDGTWATYKKLTGTFAAALPAGQQILRVTITGQYANLDKMNLKWKSDTAIESVVTDADAPAVIYDLQGRRVERPTHGLYIINGRLVVIK